MNISSLELANKHKFGTFFGVFLPGILSVFGVIIYLRMGFIVGQAGLFQTLAIIALGSFITLLTALSIASIATNIDVGKGGTYFLVSRSFGIQIGSAIGIALYVAQSLSVAFCIIGFSETLHALLPMFSITVIALISLGFLTVFVSVFMQAAMKAQLVIFLLIIASLISLFFGKFPAHYTEVSNVPLSLGFWPLFALFFPAVTGIETGLAMSGDLRNPRKSIPLGAIAIVLCGWMVYTALSIFLYEFIPRSVLINDPFIIQKFAAVKVLVLCGIWAATLSSAIGGLLAAPRTLEALAIDGVVPSFIKKTIGKSEQPIISLIITVLISTVCILLGNLNSIASLLTMFKLIAYLMLNLATGTEAFLGNPSWRPSFKVHSSVAILGALLCLLVMVLIDAQLSVIALILVSIIYFWMQTRALQGSWDDIRQGVLQFICRFAIYRMRSGTESIRSWRPHFLVFSRSPAKTTPVFKIASAITKDRGFLTIASIFTTGNEQEQEKREQQVEKFLRESHTPALVEIAISANPFEKMQELVTSYGIGSLKPNTIVIGIPKDTQQIQTTAMSIISAVKAKKNVLLVGENALECTTKHIDIWWSNEDKITNEFMLLMSNMLIGHKNWKHHNIILKNFVADEKGRLSRQEHFKQLLSLMRFNIEVDTLVVSNPQPADMGKLSQNPAMMFAALPLWNGEDSVETYAETLKPFIKLSSQAGLIVYSYGVTEFHLQKTWSLIKRKKTASKESRNILTAVPEPIT